MDATIIVAAIGAVSGLGGASLAARSSRTAARDTAASQERQARETAASQERVEQERLRREEIGQLRANLEAIIGRLNEEVRSARDEVKRVREQLDREEVVSDQLRGRVRDLEEQVHRLNMTILQLQQQLAMSGIQAVQTHEAELEET
jgi:chromosome segregation ATPase